MKKILLALCVCAGLCACSSDDDLVSSTSTGNSSREAAAYLTVNLKDVNSLTRATSGGFGYGTEAEQTVSNAYFYFYDNDGKYLANGAVASVSGTASETGTSADGNIEWKSNTLVAVYGLYADQALPTQMLTVLNKPSGINLENQTLSNAIATLAGTPYADESGNFVMSTSVYEGSSAVYTTALEEDDFSLEPINLEGDYPNGGVAVYVERLAAKVGVNDGITNTGAGATGANYHAYALTAEEQENFPMGLPATQGTDVLAIQLLGFDVDAVARDAYLVKNIDTDWSLGDNFTWNAADYYRCYWAESPNYGVEHAYPTTNINPATGIANTDETEVTSPLDEYLRYVSLASPVAIGSTTYCGENTNTVDVIDAADNNGLTNVIVKAQFGTWSQNYNTLTGIDLIEYHGEYYTAADFCQKTVDDVVNYDFTVVVNEVIAALKGQMSFFSDYLDQLNDAIIKDHVYKSTAVDGHIITSENAPTDASDITAFGGEMLSLYNLGDGNVDIFYNMSTQPQWGNGTENYPWTNIDPTLADKYPASDIVYNKNVDLDNYEFWFHIDSEKIDNITSILQSIGLVVKIGDDYYMPIDNNISFTTESTFDNNFTGSHTYTMRNFLLRAITVEADGIDQEFGSHYPNFYNNGMMYYNVPIEHLNTTTGGDLVEGEYGVVRNHWYNVTITSLEGLGRGIADEDEVIVPLPEVQYYYLGADIDILSWHMVEQSVNW